MKSTALFRTDSIKEQIVIKQENLALDAVQSLLSCEGISVDPEDEMGITPLYDASSWGYNEIVELLVRAGADLEATSLDGDTPLKVAASWGYVDTVEVTSTDSSWSRSNKVFQLLIELGVMVDRQTGRDQDTALMMATYFGYRDIVKTLLQAGADPNLQDMGGYTALMWSKLLNHRRISKLLIDHGAL